MTTTRSCPCRARQDIVSTKARRQWYLCPQCTTFRLVASRPKEASPERRNPTIAKFRRINRNRRESQRKLLKTSKSSTISITWAGSTPSSKQGLGVARLTTMRSSPQTTCSRTRTKSQIAFTRMRPPRLHIKIFRKSNARLLTSLCRHQTAQKSALPRATQRFRNRLSLQALSNKVAL